MKNNAKIVTLIFSLILFPIHTLHSYLDDSFDVDFKTEIDKLEKNMQTFQSSLKEFHHKFFEDFDLKTRDFIHYADQQNLNNKNQTTYAYQQTTNSLSFANNEKSIKIVEQKDKDSIIYSIHVTNKKGIEATSNDEVNPIAELKNLQNYMQNHFHSKRATTILAECLTALAEEDKKNLIKIDSTSNGNETKYKIEIAQKAQEVPTQYEQHKKKVKKHHRTHAQ